MNYLLTFLLIEVLILLHELGHFLVARRVGIPIARFSVGFGPRIWSLRSRDTEFWLSAVPIGGYVLPAIPDEASYFRLPLTKRLLFALGGPVTNLLIPIPLFVVLNVLNEGITLSGLVVRPFTETWAALCLLLSAVPMAFSRPDAMSGFIGLITQGAAFVGDRAEAVRLAVFMSLNLGLFNLLPLPLLDGGKIALDLAHRLNPGVVRYVRPITVCGVLLLLGLQIAVTVSDIFRLVA